MIQYRAASCGGGRSSCPGAELTVETIHGIPLYGADLETADGIPERVAAPKEIFAADGLPS
jgi:hypothetical protein